MCYETFTIPTVAFDSTLHEMQCSDGQYISVLRKWNGEEFACLPEIWRKYFPEVRTQYWWVVLVGFEFGS